MGRDNDVIADPRDQWMYFFRRAEGSTAKELLEWLPDPVFKRAAGVLEMISRTTEPMVQRTSSLPPVVRAS